MVDPYDVMRLVNHRLNRLLTIAEACLPPEQFRAFRKVALDEFGRNGMERELWALLKRERAH